jgi:hypothetical protein
MVQFALEGYKEATPQSLYRTPNSVVGRLLGHVYRWAAEPALA